MNKITSMLFFAIVLTLANTVFAQTKAGKAKNQPASNTGVAIGMRGIGDFGGFTAQISNNNVIPLTERFYTGATVGALVDVVKLEEELYSGAKKTKYSYIGSSIAVGPHLGFMADVLGNATFLETFLQFVVPAYNRLKVEEGEDDYHYSWLGKGEVNIGFSVGGKYSAISVTKGFTGISRTGVLCAANIPIFGSEVRLSGETQWIVSMVPYIEYAVGSNNYSNFSIGVGLNVNTMNTSYQNEIVNEEEEEDN